ncbi:PTS sugar transporter subunit IIA [Pseudoclavibacter chungangensis]|uniref:Ascorbate-specific PTS system EIIA component n=1 Tax=Pseudoclavibacter chungangensis TaxID=587635 RepID=A0A7J5BYL8_9MICO|nr:PTS sugar transporter subunit IIA [Pseudoclavibacter chungangensis]KAB1659445.1 PTS sugar transporter subunit IIA [Pseudoclavibacter chungangensis]NYJ67702.1 PTS system ascorbate-specific IIA component [Pseudoclavibacter chungangensis]
MNASSVELAFGPGDVRLGLEARSWRDAVDQAGALLVSRGATTAGYTRRMLEVIETYGPYMVVAPGVALVHAKPGSDVRHNGAVILTFPDGVDFGHRRFDPVRAVVGIAVRRPDEHVTIIAAIARLLDSDGTIDALLSATDADALARGVAERLAEAGIAVDAPDAPHTA